MRRIVVLIAVLGAVASVAASVTARETETGLRAPTAAVPFGSDGGFLVADAIGCVVKRGAADGTLTPFAGTGTCSSGADGGLATATSLGFPTVAVPTSDGSVLIAEGAGIFGCKVRKVDSAGTITTAAGVGTCGNTNDGMQATSAQVSFTAVVPFNAPNAAVQTPGDGFLLSGGCRVRKVDGAGTITTVAGADCPGSSPFLNGMSCTAGLCMGAGGGGRVTVSTTPGDRASWRVRQAGNPEPSGDTLQDVSCPSTSFCAAVGTTGHVMASGNPTSATPTWTRNDAVIPDNAVYSIACTSASMCVIGDQRGILRVSTDPGVAAPTWTPNSIEPNNVSIVDFDCFSATLCLGAANSGKVLFSTTPETAASWGETDDLGPGIGSVTCASATQCFAGSSDGKIFRTTTPTVAAAANWPAVQTTSTSEIRGISCPTLQLCVAVDQTGNSIISTNADQLTPTWTVDDLPGEFGATDVDCQDATLCIATRGENRLVTTNPAAADPTWELTSAFNPQLDNVPATSQPLNNALSAVPTADGGFLVVESSTNPNVSRVRKVLGGTVTVVAGTGLAGFSGDGGQATAAQLNRPVSAVPTADGGFLIADGGNCVIRKVSSTGVISTVAGVAPSGGTPSCGTDGVGASATAAQLLSPTAAVSFTDGSYLIGSQSAPPGQATNAPLRKVTAGGTLVSAVEPGATATPTAGPTETPTTAPPGSTPTPTATATPTVGPSTPAKPTCTLVAGSSKVKVKGKPKLKPVARCSQAVAAKLTGTIKVKGKTIAKLSASAALTANAAKTFSLKVSKKVKKAVKKGKKASVALTLAATNANGTATATASIAKLKKA